MYPSVYNDLFSLLSSQNAIYYLTSFLRSICYSTSVDVLNSYNAYYSSVMTRLAEEDSEEEEEENGETGETGEE